MSTTHGGAGELTLIVQGVCVEAIRNSIELTWWA